VFQEIRWLKWFAYLPFFGLLVFDTVTRYSMLPRSRWPVPKTVSVVIPTLNEADRIEAAIQSARTQKGVVEIIVADGRSSDTTRDVARRCGAKVISGPTGRGRQVRNGIKHTCGDVIVVLHADSNLLAEASDRMLKALAEYPSAAGGAFKMAFNSHSPKLKLIAWLNNFRGLVFGISFGDQGQFVRRQALKKIGGFPDMMLMEDVELSMRLKSFSRPLFVRRGILVSWRRWQHKHFGQNVWLVIRLFLRYLLERRFLGAQGVRTNYYKKYYQKP
jgi:rSAM/selenodomain-associated transferase 2